MSAQKFELFMGCLGNGTIVCNKAVEEYGDYKKVAHISTEGEITWYVPISYVPEDARAKIETVAARDKAKYQEWFNSLPYIKQYEITLSKMSATELIAHIEKKMEERKNGKRSTPAE